MSRSKPEGWRLGAGGQGDQEVTGQRVQIDRRPRAVRESMKHSQKQQLCTLEHCRVDFLCAHDEHVGKGSENGLKFPVNQFWWFCPLLQSLFQRRKTLRNFLPAVFFFFKVFLLFYQFTIFLVLSTMEKYFLRFHFTFFLELSRNRIWNL